MGDDPYHTTTENVGALLSATTRHRIVVPEFQRGYEWTTEEVGVFWDDLVLFLEERGQPDGQEKHFFGPIVTQTKSKVIELLDGQQRMATVTMLFCVLRDVAKTVVGTEAEAFVLETHRGYIAKDEDQFALQLGETDEKFFREYVQQDGKVTAKPKIRTHRNIRDAKQLLQKKVEGLVEGSSTPKAKIKSLRNIRQVLQSDLVMARIFVEKDQDAFRIFETLNDRGLSLAAPDLILVHLMRKAKNASRRKIIRQIWTDMVEEVGAKNIDKFIRTLWVSRFGDVKKAKLFTVIRTYIQTEKPDPVEFARSCESECAAYVSLITADEEELGDASRHVKTLISILGVEAAIPLLLSAVQGFEDKVWFTKVCQWLIVFVVRYAALANQERSGLENILFSLAKEVRDRFLASACDQKALQREIAEGIKEKLISEAPTNDQIRNFLPTIKLNTKNARYVLLTIANTVQAENGEVSLNKVTLEHVYPQNPDPKEWGGATNQEILDPLLWHIGNLTYLGNKLNSKKCQNKEFRHKLPIYRDESRVLMTKKIADHYKVWDVAAILARGGHVVDRALKIWDFDRLSKV